MSARGWKLQLADASILIIEWWYLDHSLKLICKLLLCLNLFEFKFKIVYNSKFYAQQKVSYTRIARDWRVGQLLRVKVKY
ncbi:hypothetical protein CSV67_09720 [Sporosarcina sp. P2]|nr:hypothetical protein CSV67_09720 [Sporosarcina sp. P2]